MKKHIIGFTIFAFIVGSFISVFALLGYFTQTIPNVPRVESENLPVFKSDRKKSCFKQQREKISYDVVDSYYFADENLVVSTLKLKWNGYGVPPENIFVSQKVFTADKKLIMPQNKEAHPVTFDNFNREIKFSFETKAPFDLSGLNENFYTDFTISSETGENLGFNKIFQPEQVIVVHDKSPVISK